MFSPKRKWLARRAAGHNHHILKASVTEPPDIGFMQRPLLDGSHPMALIFAECLAGIVIPFDDRGMMKPRVRHPHRKTTRSGE